jgi:hypothetical protein
MKNKIDTQRPSPSSPQEQAEPRLEAGEGLDVTACSASLFDGGVCVESVDHPYWIGKTPDQIMDEIEYGVGVIKRHNEAVKSGNIELQNLLDEEIASLLAARS